MAQGKSERRRCKNTVQHRGRHAKEDWIGLDWIGLQSIAAGFNGGDLSALSVDSTADKSTHGHKL